DDDVATTHATVTALGLIAAQPDLTIDELTAELAAEHGVKVHRSSIGRLLLRLGLSHKKRPASA
ncbi:MAG: winged helix-turn-helix domain-containing protein, partial [Aestuariivita sp.]